MKFCEHCKNGFRNTYDLNRHLARKFKCVAEIQTPSEENLKKEKEKNDMAEIKALKITNTLAKLKDNLTPEAIEIANLTKQRKLDKMRKLTLTVEPETTVTVETKIPIEVLEFGKTNETVDAETVIGLLRTVVKQSCSVYRMTTALVTSYDALLTQNPQNRNVRIRYAKCMFADVWRGTTWHKETVKATLSVSFQDRAQRLANLRPTIEQTNPRVFANKTVGAVWIELAQFAKHGLDHGPNATELRDAQTAFKVGKLV